MKLYSSPRPLQLGFAGALAAFVFAPTLYVLCRSLQNPILFSGGGLGGVINRHLCLASYRQVLFEHPFYWAGYWNTIFLTVPALLLAAVTAVLAAYGFLLLSRKMAAVLQSVYLLLALLPAQVLLVPNYMALHALGLLGNRLSIILTAGLCPCYACLVQRFTSGIGQETLEAARLDGARELRVCWQIALPQMRAGVMTALLAAAADLWGMAEQPLAFLQSVSRYPLSILFEDMEQRLQSAGAVVFSAPMVVLFVCAASDLLQQMTGESGERRERP